MLSFKKIFIFFLFQFFFFHSKSQVNLVPNPSFESYTACPSGQSQINKATGWSSYRSTPDYYNVCSNYSTGVSVPSNDFGFQYASSGSGYAGFFAYYPINPTGRETMGCKLTSTLTVGTKYYVSFNVNLCRINVSLGYNTAVDHLGIRFFTIPFNQSTPTPTNNFAHIYSTNIISDTLNWTKISGSFIADSSYQYLAIGNFFDDVTTNKNYFDASANKVAYYYTDDICVSTDSNYCASWNGIIDNRKKVSVSVYPNPMSEYTTIEILDIPSGEISVLLYDISGRLVNSINKITSDKVIIGKSDLTSGIYILKIINNLGLNQNFKLIIE